MYYVYVLLSEKDRKFYTGYTGNLKERFDAHQTGKVSSTQSRRPFVLVYYEASRDRKDALKREEYLKTYYGKAYIKKRIKTYLTGYSKN